MGKVGRQGKKENAGWESGMRKKEGREGGSIPGFISHCTVN